jgi:hypothetical protein
MTIRTRLVAPLALAAGLLLVGVGGLLAWRMRSRPQG